uniref:Uncharacterized protein n=1 Tax=Ascaris lumbricoides TaxID=6252 RepID=A0A9J2Q0F7_ASCLU
MKLRNRRRGSSGTNGSVKVEVPSALDRAFLVADGISGAAHSKADGEGVREEVIKTKRNGRKNKRHKASDDDYRKIALFLARKLEEGCWKWKGNEIWKEAEREKLIDISAQALRKLALKLPAKLDEIDITPEIRDLLYRKMEVAEIRRHRGALDRFAADFKPAADNSSVDEGRSDKHEDANRRIKKTVDIIMNTFVDSDKYDIDEEELLTLVESAMRIVSITSKYGLSPLLFFQ